MKNMRVSLKLIISFLIIAAMAAVVGAVGIYGLTQLEAKDTELYESNLLAIAAMASFRESYQSERTQLRTIILSPGGYEEKRKIADSFANLEKTIKDAMTSYEDTITDDSLEEGYYAAKDAYLGDYAKAKENIINASLEGDDELAYQLLLEAGPVVAPIVEGLQKSAVLNDQLGRESNLANKALAWTLIIVQISVLAFAILVAIILAFYISGMISKPLAGLTAFMKKAGTTGSLLLTQEEQNTLSQYSHNKDEIGQCIDSTTSFINHLAIVASELEHIASGDLSIELLMLSDKDTMGLSLQKMINSLNVMFAEINASTLQVSTGSKQIADGAQALAQGSTEQAAAVEQLSSSITEIANKTKINANKADDAAKLADTIKKNAEKGSAQMDQMMSAVREIGEASQSINTVIKVIDNIAFQTNILALNASVEAARAGQHGKGFAVVADEVRSLAAKSAEAAKDTGSLIANSIEKAEFGARIAGETAASLTDIVSGINDSSQLVGEIAQSSEEQAISISQINKGIDQVAQVIQQNSATAEESAAASEEMSGQADMLEALITQFKLKSDAQSHRLTDGKASRKRVANTESIADFSGEGYGKY